MTRHPLILPPTPQHRIGVQARAKHEMAERGADDDGCDEVGVVGHEDEHEEEGDEDGGAVDGGAEEARGGGDGDAVVYRLE